MKKKVLKVLALVVAIALIIGIGLFAGIIGSAIIISKYLRKEGSEFAAI